MQKTSTELVEGIPRHGVCQYSWAHARAELVQCYAKTEAYLTAADEVEKLLAEENLAAIAAWVKAIRVIAAEEEE